MLRDFLRTPSSFPADPVGGTTNQGGHAGLGMLVAWYFGPWALPFIAVIYAVWEALQWREYGGEDWDCVDDWCFVMTGAVAASEPVLLPILAAWLLAGYLRRADAQKVKV
jgi:hypothetical protein